MDYYFENYNPSIRMKHMDFNQEDYYEDSKIFNWNKLTKLLLFEEDSF